MGDIVLVRDYATPLRVSPRVLARYLEAHGWNVEGNGPLRDRFTDARTPALLVRLAAAVEERDEADVWAELFGRWVPIGGRDG